MSKKDGQQGHTEHAIKYFERAAQERKDSSTPDSDTSDNWKPPFDLKKASYYSFIGLQSAASRCKTPEELADLIHKSLVNTFEEGKAPSLKELSNAYRKVARALTGLTITEFIYKYMVEEERAYLLTREKPMARFVVPKAEFDAAIRMFYKPDLPHMWENYCQGIFGGKLLNAYLSDDEPF